MDHEPDREEKIWRGPTKGAANGISGFHGGRFNGTRLYKILVTFCVVNRLLTFDLSTGLIAVTVPQRLEEQLASFIKVEIPHKGWRKENVGTGSNGPDLDTLFSGNELISHFEKASLDLESKTDSSDEEQGAQLPLVLSDLDVSRAEASLSGTGGVHFIPEIGSSEFKVVFKPREEENASTRGTGFVREYAAYLIDNGVAGVPETAVTILNIGKGPQLGSAQMFVKDSEDAEDFGFGAFSVEDVHRIGVLDLRILNCDRHSGNLMRNKVTGKLVPIDHGAAFPELDALGDCSFEWLRYPQAKEPFDQATKEEIRAIEIDKDLEKLSLAGLSVDAQLATWMSTCLLKMGVAQGKTLFEIGSLVQREGDRSEPSELEKLYERVKKESGAQFSKPLFQQYAQELIG